MTEKVIEAYPNYSVYPDGKIINNKTGRVLKLDLNSCDYLRATLCMDNRPKKFFVHRLVAEAFLDNPDNLPQVNHINGDKQDNSVENLEWCTQSINQYHAHHNGLQKRYTKVSEDQVKTICELLSEGVSIRTISSLMKISRYIPEDIKRKKTWLHISKDYF